VLAGSASHREHDLTSKTRTLVASCILAVALTGAGCSAELTCQEIVDQYSTASGIASAAGCNPSDPNACSVLLPYVDGTAGADGSDFLPDGLVSNCFAGFDPDQSMNLQSLYSQFQAQGCKAFPIPVCGYNAPTRQCLLDVVGVTTATGYFCG
jgi:hypothetical protein